MNQDVCPNCPNHCTKDSLRCGRGRSYFGLDEHNEFSKEVKEPSSLGEYVISDIRKCGHFLHHNRDFSVDSLLENLNEEELTQLHELLSKINMD